MCSFTQRDHCRVGGSLAQTLRALHGQQDSGSIAFDGERDVTGGGEFFQEVSSSLEQQQLNNCHQCTDWLLCFSTGQCSAFACLLLGLCSAACPHCGRLSVECTKQLFATDEFSH